MQQRDRLALVAGISIGLWGGALGAFLICTATWAATCRVLNRRDEQCLELRLPALSERSRATDQSPSTALTTAHG
jgi:hypothetical protein